jgi:hypothetical protein
MNIQMSSRVLRELCVSQYGTLRNCKLRCENRPVPPVACSSGLSCSFSFLSRIVWFRVAGGGLGFVQRVSRCLQLMQLARLTVSTVNRNYEVDVLWASDLQCI